MEEKEKATNKGRKMIDKPLDEMTPEEKRRSGNGNLRIPTSEEARELGRKGGLASGESRRKRKTLREELLDLLSEGDIQQRITVALADQALDGNVKAYETMRDTIGEKPTDQVDTTIEVKMGGDISKFGV